MLEANVLGKPYRQRHHQDRPHASLNYQTPQEFAQRSLLPADLIATNPNPEIHEKL